MHIVVVARHGSEVFWQKVDAHSESILDSEAEIASSAKVCALVPLRFEEDRRILRPTAHDIVAIWQPVANTLHTSLQGSVRLTKDKGKGKGRKREQACQPKKRRIVTDSQDE